ncbi:MFS transporter [Nocardioides sp. TRM66260-LWL]|uniref:MFS transporter n=1 Tax=Nocardioides sp. TRM66260-LWL TaxID=2874478 RepID=UPI001CC7B43E|nr:MFS transporter [Nocardioides sp. TRM66260-LWL]MBZ5734541.1 MFS transporter [Nocardioides sp. TRM66260-LWL]
MSPTFRSLANPNYRRYATGGLVSNVGTWLQRVAQDWLVLLLSGSGAAIGVTTGLQFLPVLLLAPIAGVVADRMPKRRLLQLTNLGMALPALVLGLLAVTGTVQLWHVYVLALVLGAASAFDGPARQSFVSELVERRELTNAIALNSVSFNSARIVGPGLAGVLIAAFGNDVPGTGWVILLNAASYAAPIVGLSRLDASRLRPARLLGRERGQVRAGFAYLRRRPDLLAVLGVVFATGTFGLNFQLTSALMATQVFGRGPTEYGLLGTVMAVGSLTGSLLAARRAESGLRLIVGAALAFGAVEMAAGLMPSYLTYALICPLLGLCALTMITSANVFMQTRAEPAMRGRVMAVYLMVFTGGTPLGSPFIGWVGERYGARWTLLVGGLLTILGTALAAALLQRGRRRRAVLTGPTGAGSLSTRVWDDQALARARK